MIVHETSVRVRYGETDQMGVVYHAQYIKYFEIGRTELVRSLGISYKEMESTGVMMPVTEYHIRMVRPAKYDDQLTIKSKVSELPDLRMKVDSQIMNEEGKLVAGGRVVLAFLDAETRKTIPAPKALLVKMREAFPELS